MKPKKSLGQNFLNSPKALKEIIASGKLTINDNVIEIGPGKGALTVKILETGATVIAIEKDRELIPYLNDKFKTYIDNKKLILIEGDILEWNIESELRKLKIKNYKLIANIPYYITGAIIRKFLETKTQPSLMVLLVQKEVAIRTIAEDKKESLLSLSIKVYGEPKLVSFVPRGAFHPVPNVDSAVLLINNISRKNLSTTKHEENFFKLIHLGFAHKRKTLWHNFKELVNREDFFIKNKLEQNSRAEDLGIGEWIKISK